MRQLCILLTLCVLTLTALSQTTPFIDAETERLLVNELSGDHAYDNLRWLALWHRTSASRDYHEAAQFIEKRAKEYGLVDVKIVRHKATNPGWSASFGELWVVEPSEVKLGSYADYAVALATNSRTTHVKAPLVDVGAGTTDADYEGNDVSGKIVLASGSVGAVMNQAVWKRGALGIVSHMYQTFPRISSMVDRPDQVAWGNLPYKNADGKESTFGFMVSPRKGKMLQDMLKNGPVTVKVDIEAEFNETAWEEYVEGWIRGTSISDQQIFLTAHLQEEKPSYNDDASGCVSILEIARTLNRLIKEGRIPRPKRDIRFFWADEISSEYQYFQDHPEDRKKVLVNINQDMVGAKQSLGSRVQHVTRTPHSIPSYLSDVVANIATYVMLGNTHFITTAGAGQSQPYSKPILSHLGTRERFAMLVVPYFNSTDHLVFNEGIIGVPGVTLTNMPDDFIHSSDDDAFQIDQTQIKRNAFIVASAAWYLANAEETEAPVIAFEVYHTAMKRIHTDGLAAANHILKNKNNSEAAYKEARNVIEQAYVRESRAVESARVFAAKAGAGGKQIDNLKNMLMSQQGGSLSALDEYYKSVTSKATPKITLTEKEKQLSRKVPQNIENVADYFTKRQGVGGVPGLHNEMRYEALNFVNGKDSYLDIFNAVQAEAISAGEYYYGKVTLEAIEQLLDKAVASGCVTLK
ncbi:MAG: M28 family peptidase [Ignavibacteriae bacterium]|nr:M28 family peptidase [Ignavibacteriota bacterium]